MDATACTRLSRLVWSGDIAAAEEALRMHEGSMNKRLYLLLSAHASFVRALVTGDERGADETTALLAECEKLCASERSSSWGEWAGSLLSSKKVDEAREAVLAQQALCTLMRCTMLGARQHRMAAALAMRAAYKLFSSIDARAQEAAPIRDFGVGFFGVLLSLLPKFIVRLLAVAGYGGLAEKQGFEMLERCSKHKRTTFDGGARWLSQMMLISLRMLKADLSKAATQNPSASSTESADGKVTKPSRPLRPSHADGATLHAVAVLQADLPRTLLADWLEALVLRRLGRLPDALQKMDAVIACATRSIETKRNGDSNGHSNGSSNGHSHGAANGNEHGGSKVWQAYRVRFQHAQLLFILRRYTDCVPALQPLAALESRFTARAMCNVHLAAAFGALGRCAEAREVMARVKTVAEQSKGQMDEQLAQRAAGWLTRDDAFLPICALEIMYMMHYFKSISREPAHLSSLRSDVQPVLESAKAATELDAKLAAMFVSGALALNAEEFNLAELEFKSVCETAGGTTLPDCWHVPFAQLELGGLLMAKGDLEGAAAELKKAAAVPQASYSFHSWLAASIRASRAKLRTLKKEKAGKAPSARAREGGNDADGGESEDDDGGDVDGDLLEVKEDD